MKKLYKIVTLIFMVALLSGCMKIEVNIKIKDDKSASMGLQILASSLLYGDETDADSFISDMKEQIQLDDSYKGAIIKEKKEMIDGEQWAGVYIDVPGDYDLGLDLKEEKKDGENCLVLTMPIADVQSLLHYQTGGNYSFSELKEYGVEMKMNITMPHNAQSNVGVVKGKTVSLDLIDILENNSGQDIVIYSPIKGNFNMNIIYVGIAVIGIIGIVYFLTKKKKTEEPVIEEQPLTQTHIEKTCPHCGALLSDDVQSCPVCGKEIIDNKNEVENEI